MGKYAGTVASFYTNNNGNVGRNYCGNCVYRARCQKSPGCIVSGDMSVAVRTAVLKDALARERCRCLSVAKSGNRCNGQSASKGRLGYGVEIYWRNSAYLFLWSPRQHVAAAGEPRCQSQLGPCPVTPRYCAVAGSFAQPPRCVRPAATGDLPARAILLAML